MRPGAVKTLNGHSLIDFHCSAIAPSVKVGIGPSASVERFHAQAYGGSARVSRTDCHRHRFTAVCRHTAASTRMPVDRAC